MSRSHLRSLSIALASLTLLCGGAVSGQERRYVDPRTFGFEITPGRIDPGNGEAVLTADNDNNPVVGKIHINVGDSRIVLLPDGQLVGRTKAASPLTDRKFEPISKDELAERLLATEFRGFKSKQTNRYLYIYNTSDKFALGTSRIMETMFPGVVGYSKKQKIDVHDPDVPLVVVMFKTDQEFQQYQRMPDGVVAYYHTVNNRVLMYEESPLMRRNPEMALQQAISTIAHEGAHQILHNIGVQQRLSVWPMWLSEGLAEFYAPTSFGRRLRWKGAGQVNDMRMFELELYLKSRESEQPDGQMIEDTVRAARLTSTGYAAAWSLTHFLARTKRADFNKYVKEISQLGPLEVSGEVVAPGIVPNNVTRFQQHFGDDFGKLEDRLVAHLKRQPYNDPFAEYPHWVAMILLPGSRANKDANVFHTERMARKWARETLETVEAGRRAGAQVQFREFRNRAGATTYAQQWLRQ